MSQSKSKHRRLHADNRVQREAVDFSNRRLLGQKRYYSKSRQRDFDRSYLREVEDRREFHPEGVARPARSFSSSRHRLFVPVRKPKAGYDSYDPFGSVPTAVGFKNPSKVLICVRRKIRREVLHAKANQMRRSLGSISRQFKPSKYSEYSSVEC